MVRRVAACGRSRRRGCARPASSTALWAAVLGGLRRGALSWAGCSARWSIACSASFFRGFNWVFDRPPMRTATVAGSAAGQRDRPAGLRRVACGSRTSGSARCRSASSRSRTRAIWWSTPSSPTARASSAPTRSWRGSARSPRNDARRGAHDQPAGLLGADQQQHLQRRRHVRDPCTLRGTGRARAARS